MPVHKEVWGGIKDAGKALGGKVKDAAGGIKDAGKWVGQNIDELDDALHLKQLAQIGQFIPGPQQPFVKGLAMVYAGSDAFKATSEGNPLGVLSAGLQLSGSSKIDTGGVGISENIKNYLPKGEWLAEKYGALPGIGKNMVQRAGLQALIGSGRSGNEGGYYPPAQISAGAPIQGRRAAPYMADYNLRTPQFAEGGWISPRPNGDGVITTLGDTPSGEEIVIPADKYLAYMANGGTVGRIPSFAGGKGERGENLATYPEGGWTEDIPFPSKSTLLDLILANTKEREGASKGGGWKDSPLWDLLGYGGIAAQMLWDYYKGKKPAEQAQERAEYANAYRDAVRPEQTGRREFPTYNRLPTQIPGYELPPLAGGAHIESNRAMPGLVAETARQKGPLMASEYVGSPGAVLRDLGLTRRGVQDVLNTNPVTLQSFAAGVDYIANKPGETGEDTGTGGPAEINYSPGTTSAVTEQQGIYDMRGLLSGYQGMVGAGGGRTGITNMAGQQDERAGRDMNQIKKDYWMQISANRRANQQSASAIDVAQRGAGRDDYLADIYGWNVGDTSDINWAGLGDKAAGNMRMSRFSPGDISADWVEGRRRSRYARDQYS